MGVREGVRQGAVEVRGAEQLGQWEALWHEKSSSSSSSGWAQGRGPWKSVQAEETGNAMRKQCPKRAGCGRAGGALGSPRTGRALVFG